MRQCSNDLTVQSYQNKDQHKQIASVKMLTSSNSISSKTEENYLYILLS